MDVAQPGIKINQTNQLQLSLSLKTKQKENTILSFDQVLAIAALGGQQPKTENIQLDNTPQKTTFLTSSILGPNVGEGTDQNPLLNLSLDSSLEQTEPTDGRNENWDGILPILVSLLDVLQPFQMNSIEEASSQIPNLSVIHNPADISTIQSQKNPVNAQNPMESITLESLIHSLSSENKIDIEILQSLPNNGLVSKAIQEPPLQNVNLIESNLSNAGSEQSNTLSLPLQDIEKEILRLIQTLKQSDQKTNPDPSTAAGMQNVPELNALNDEKQENSMQVKHAIRDIQMKLTELLNNVGQKNWTELKDDRSFFQGLKSLVNDLQEINNQVLPEKVNEVSRKINVEADPLRQVKQIELPVIPIVISKNGEPQDQRLTHTKNNQDFARNLNASNLGFSPLLQGKHTPESNKLKNGNDVFSQNELQKLGGQDLVLNQPQSNPNQWSISDDVKSTMILPINDFVPELNEFVGRFVKLNKGEFGSTEAKFSLFPENLGHVGVKILTHEGQITAQIITETPAAKQALEGQLHQLRQALLDQGLIVQKLDIIQQSVPSSNTSQADLSFSQGNSGFSREHRTFNPDENGVKKGNSLDQLEIDNEAPPNAYRGTNSNFTSNIDFSA